MSPDPDVVMSVIESADHYFYFWLKIAAVYGVCFAIILAITRP